MKIIPDTAIGWWNRRTFHAAVCVTFDNDGSEIDAEVYGYRDEHWRFLRVDVHEARVLVCGEDLAFTAVHSLRNEAAKFKFFTDEVVEVLERLWVANLEEVV